MVKAEEIMITDLYFITKATTYRQLRDLLATAPTLRSFPIVTDSGKNTVFVKMIDYFNPTFFGFPHPTRFGIETISDATVARNDIASKDERT
jgi:hypothetical protein